MAKNVPFTLEYSFRASPTILYNLVSTPSGLAMWFADTANFIDDECIFSWEGAEDVAYIVDSLENEFIRYRWDYMDDDEYFEFKLSKSEVTGATILTVTDFGLESDLEEDKLLWDKQIKQLATQVGG